jgi:alpha-beta hydrolase superfamily lysophospholipase
MGVTFIPLLKRTALILGVSLVAVLAWRIYDSERGPALQPWHLQVPHELDAEELDRSNWSGWLKAEDRVFSEVRQHVSEQLDLTQVPALNRYRLDSPVYPPRFSQDWNRSYVLEPDGPPKGVVVLLHGLTDSPYSLRHIAQRYREQGYLAIGLRLPGHGSVPAALTAVDWQDWLAATRLALRTARERVPAPLPLHLVGYSNGGALAVKYSLDAVQNPQLPQADRLVLLSPMIGVAQSARFAGLISWPAVFPAFSKSAWLLRLPEYNPFKYNSFPANAVRQSWLLTDALQSQVARLAQQRQLETLPPILSFQSVADATVSTPALISGLYRHLPENGSELVLFDLNRAMDFGGLLDPAASDALAHLLPAPPRHYRTRLITNAGPGQAQMQITSTEADSVQATEQPLGLSYPQGVFSLSHVALPFPEDDALYGPRPKAGEDFGIQLGRLAARGERGVLQIPLDDLQRLTSNPFYPYLLQRIDDAIASTPTGNGARP